MNPQPGGSQPSGSSKAAPSTIPLGRWMAIARAAWVVVALMALVSFVTGLPDLYSKWRVLYYIRAEHRDAMRDNLAQLGLSTDFHAAYVLLLLAIFAAECFTLATIIFLRGSDKPMAMLVALFLVLSGTIFSGDIEASGPLRPAFWRHSASPARYCCSISFPMDASCPAGRAGSLFSSLYLFCPPHSSRVRL
jgi:hypothetical protein